MKYSEWKEVPPPPSHEEWAKLYAGLVQASEYARMRLEYNDAPVGFMAAELSLLSVIGYLQSSTSLMAEGAVIPLLTLASALRDLRAGSAPQLLSPKKASSRRPGERRRAHVIGLAARAFDRLKSGGVAPEDAKRQVYAAIKQGKAVGWQTVTPAMIVNWRNKCNAGMEDDVPKAAIQKYREKLYANEPAPLAEAAMLLQILSEAKERGLG